MIRCALCEQNEATETYVLPVCPSCLESLRATESTLVTMEANDPHLAELGRRIDETARRLFGPPTRTETTDGS